MKRKRRLRRQKKTKKTRQAERMEMKEAATTKAVVNVATHVVLAGKAAVAVLVAILVAVSIQYVLMVARGKGCDHMRGRNQICK